MKINKSLPPLEVKSNGFDGQPEILANCINVLTKNGILELSKRFLRSNMKKIIYKNKEILILKFMTAEDLATKIWEIESKISVSNKSLSRS